MVLLSSRQGGYAGEDWEHFRPPRCGALEEGRGECDGGATC